LCLLAVLYLGIATSFYGFSFWIPRFVGDALVQQSPSPAVVNLLSAIPYGLAVVVMLLVGRAADRHADKRLYVAIPLAVAALALGLSIAATGLLRLVLISIATAARSHCSFWLGGPLPVASQRSTRSEISAAFWRRL